MDRRGFLGTLIGGVAASTAIRTWPFRVFSFPTELTIAGVVPAVELTTPSLSAFTAALRAIFEPEIRRQLNRTTVWGQRWGLESRQPWSGFMPVLGDASDDYDEDDEDD